MWTSCGYFILRHFGGIYVDLDFECLKPIDDLLAGQRLVIGCEPPQHLREITRIKPCLGEQILCNAWMASTPNNPFWEHAIQLLVGRGKRANTLDATGPFFLTDAYGSYADQESIAVVPYAQLYPVDKHRIKEPRKQWQLQQAYAVHHWQGSWWIEKNSVKAIARRLMLLLLKHYHSWCLTLRQYLRRGYILLLPSKGGHYRLQWNMSLASRLGNRTAAEAEQIWFSRLTHGILSVRALADHQAGKTILARDNHPLISCLMVTRERDTLARKSIECFRQQSYPHKELVVIDDGEDKRLEHWVRSLEDQSIAYLRLPDEKRSLGELRNLSIQKACGQYIAQWDDDDLSHPDRLLIQMSAMAAASVQVSFLQRQIIWYPQAQKLAVSQQKMMENTIVCRKDLMTDYPDWRRGEDTMACEDLIQANEIILCDNPDLYVYLVHQKNTWGKRHFESVWNNCSFLYQGDAYNRKLQELEAVYYGWHFATTGRLRQTIFRRFLWTRASSVRRCRWDYVVGKRRHSSAGFSIPSL